MKSNKELIMIVNNTNFSPNFGAKFLNTETLKETAEYAIKNNKFEKLNTARKNIEEYDTFVKLAVDRDESGKNFVFTTYTPKYTLKNGEVKKRFKKTRTLIPAQKGNYLNELYNLIIKMGNNAPENKLYKKIIRNA